MPRSSKKPKSHTQFPARLHDLMTFAEEEGLDSSAIGWVLSGRGFIIYDTSKLMEILPHFFGKTKYKSFLRQLNMWNFERCSHGPNKGTYMHPYFVKGKRDLCDLMTRQNKKFDAAIRAAAEGPRQREKLSGNSNVLNNHIDILEKSPCTQDFGSFKTSEIPYYVQIQHPQQQQQQKQIVSMSQQKMILQEEQQVTFHKLFDSHPHQILSDGIKAITGSSDSDSMSRVGDSLVPSYPCVVLESGSATSRVSCTSPSCFPAHAASVRDFSSSRLSNLSEWFLSSNCSPPTKGSLFVLDDLEPSPIDSTPPPSSVLSGASMHQVQEMLKEFDHSNNFKEHQGGRSENETSCTSFETQQMTLALCTQSYLSSVVDVPPTGTSTYHTITTCFDNNTLLVSNENKNGVHASLVPINTKLHINQDYPGIAHDDDDDDLSCFAGRQFFMVDDWE